MSAAVSATNATTNLNGPSFAVPANTLAVGAVWRARVWFQWSRSTTTTAQSITFRLVLNTNQTTLTVAMPTTASAARHGFAEAMITCRSTGASGTAVGALHVEFSDTAGTAASHIGAANVATGTFAVDTTLSRAFRVDAQMSAAVSGTTLTLVQGVIERVV